MPLDKDPNKGGTNADKSTSDKFCSFCFKDGKFLDKGISLQEKIEKDKSTIVRDYTIDTNDEARKPPIAILPPLWGINEMTLIIMYKAT